VEQQFEERMECEEELFGAGEEGEGEGGRQKGLETVTVSDVTKCCLRMCPYSPLAPCITTSDSKTSFATRFQHGGGQEESRICYSPLHIPAARVRLAVASVSVVFSSCSPS